MLFSLTNAHSIFDLHQQDAIFKLLSEQEPQEQAEAETATAAQARAKISLQALQQEQQKNQELRHRQEMFLNKPHSLDDKLWEVDMNNQS